MPSMEDLESDLEALDEFLMSDQAPDECMMLCDLDGFLTGLAIGPEFIAPSEWLPLVWGGGVEPVFADALQAQSIIGTIMRRYNDILEQAADDAFAPIFMEGPGGEVIASDWAEGFAQAITLRPEAWDRLFKSEQHVHVLVPILALCCSEDGESILDLPEGAEQRFFEEADELIPACLLEIAEYWRAARSAPQRRPGARKPGRNDPCLCGSGKKFKKCCGREA